MSKTSLRKRDTVLLFGAGASYGSEKDCINTPPLGKDLFSELAKQKGPFSRLSARQKEIFETGDFEAGMATIRDSNVSIRPLQNELSIFLSGFQASKNNAYNFIFRNLPKPKQTAVCTLNYDLLIEQCLDKCNMPFSYNAEKRAIPLLKIHGSSNFLPMLRESGLHLDNAVMENCGTHIEGVKTGAVSRQDEIIRWILDPSNNSVSPVMAMYNKEKRVVINRKLIDSIQNNYKKCMSTARIVIVSGVRFLQHDAHIWNAIKSTKGKVIISDPYPEDSYNWLRSEGKENVEYIKDGFFDSKKEIIENLSRYS